MSSGSINRRLCDDVSRIFLNKTGSPPAFISKAPGRINLIGEHTDHNLGLVMPAAIEQAIYFAIGRSDQRVLHLMALDKDEELILKSLEDDCDSWCERLE